MIISVENAYTGNDFRKIFSFHYKKTAEDVVREVLRSEKCPFDAEVSIRIVDDDEIRRYNKETRGIDKPTDVLSERHWATNRWLDVATTVSPAL